MWTIDPHWYLGVPNPKSESWLNYLIEPPLLSNYLASMDEESLSFMKMKQSLNKCLETDTNQT